MPRVFAPWRGVSDACHRTLFHQERTMGAICGGSINL